ncbi:MAG: polyprenol monophosphomannose synthase [Planctomycetota bacterium]|nr:polyprenol monophosphomannose synthase [Planctomycetota bacterium]
MTNSQPDSLLILICTYNERDNLPTLFEQIQAHVPNAKILVVDDNSPDGTSDWVEGQMKLNPSISLIRRSGKLGLGSAILAGMEFAIQNGYEWLLNLDADLSHSPSAIPSLLDRREESDIVIGSRYVEGGGMSGCSWRRVFVSKCANAYARRIIGWSVRDCSSAFRLYRVSSLKSLRRDELRNPGYGFLEEVLWHLLAQGARLNEVGIVYTERREGKSKISIQEALSAINAIHSVAKLQKGRRPE